MGAGIPGNVGRIGVVMRRRGFMAAFRSRPMTRSALRQDDGVTLVEYGLIVAAIVVVAMGAVAVLTNAVGSQYGRTSTDVGSPQVIAAPANAVPGLTCTGGNVANQAGNACVTLTVMCAEAGQIPNVARDGCVPNQAAYCVQAGQLVNHAGTGCVIDRAAFCAEVSQIPDHSGAGCVADQAAFCAEVGQLVNHAGNGCVTQAGFCIEVGQVANHAGTGCVTPAGFCAEIGKWLNPGTGNCDTKVICLGQQTFNDANNSCTPPTCSAAQWYNAGTGNCDSKASCTASQWYNGATNKCDTKAICIGAQTFNSANNSCTPPTCTAGKAYNPTTGNCVTVTQTQSGSIGHDHTYTSGNVITNSQTMTATVIISQPLTTPPGTVSFAGRKISYVARSTVGTAVILFTYTSGGNTFYGTLTVAIT